MKKIYNEWLSVGTNTIYRMETTWLPNPLAKGWELLGTVEVEETGKFNRVRHNEEA